MKQKIFEVGKKAYTFNQARYEEDMGRCVITAVSERYITDDIGNKFTVSSDDRDYLTAEGNRTLRLYVSEKEALEDLECIEEKSRNAFMHPALFLLNSCILYVEQIIQKRGGNHSISVMFQSIRNRERMI